MGHTRYGKAKGAATVVCSFNWRAAFHVICYAGGWSITWSLTISYIDPTCPIAYDLSTCPAPWLAAASLAG